MANDLAATSADDKVIAATEGSAQFSQSALIAGNGVGNAHDFSCLMSQLMADVLVGAVTTEVANAVCNAGGKMLKAVEMQYRYGSKRRPKVFHLN